MQTVLIVLGALALAAGVVVFAAMAGAKPGYEDENGFHHGLPPKK